MQTAKTAHIFCTIVTFAVGWLFALSTYAQAGNSIHPVYLTEADLPEIKKLVSAGADVNAKLGGGGTALHHLVMTSAQMGVDGLMIKNKKIIRPGQWDATGHLAVAQYLVESGADIEAVDGAGMTPLHVAALTGHRDAAQYFLSLGASINAKDAKGHSPLYWAKWGATDEAIKELATATGARINPNSVKRRAAKVIEALEAAGAKE